MLVDLDPPAAGNEQVRALAAQLRLPAEHVDVPDGHARLARLVETAMQQVEARTGRALLRRRFEIRAERWPQPRCMPLPILPISGIEAFGLRDADGTETLGDLAAIRVDLLGPAPALVLTPPARLPVARAGQTAFVRVIAGYDESWRAVPPDLQQAVLLIAATLHDHGVADAQAAVMPFGALSLLEPYRRVRL